MQSKPLRFREKMAVGAGSTGVFFGVYAIKAMGMNVYQMLLGVNPAWLGFVLAVPRLWDAFLDPWVGHISDNARSRFGRRRPFIFVGALAAALVYGVIWMVPPAWSERGKLEWLFGTSLVFYTFYAVFAVPYQSLTFELSPDYGERTHVMAYCSFFYRIGTISFDWLFPLSQVAFFASPLVGVRTVNWVAAAIMLGCFGVLPALFGSERYFQQASRQPADPFWRGLRAALADRALLVVVVLTALKQAASMIASVLDYYLLVYYVAHGSIRTGSYWKGILTSGYALVGFASIPVLNWMADRWGKRETILWTSVLNIAAGAGKWLIFRPGIGWLLLLDPLLSSPNLASVSQVLPSMVADVCDQDELRCGLRREGMFGAVFLWIQKAGIAFSFFVGGVVLELCGFDSKLGGAQTAHAILGMRLVFAGATVLTSLAAVVAVFYYPITRETAEQTRRLLEARRGTP